jgi:hypothetical protein
MFGFLADDPCGVAPDVDALAVVVSDATATSARGMTRNRARRCVVTDALWPGPVSEESASHHEPVKCSMSAPA